MTGRKGWLDETLTEWHPRFVLFFRFKEQPGLLHGCMWRQRLSYSEANLLLSLASWKQVVKNSLPGIFTGRVLIAVVSVPQSANNFILII